jgi:hypothetical protein
MKLGKYDSTANTEKTPQPARKNEESDSRPYPTVADFDTYYKEEIQQYFSPLNAKILTHEFALAVLAIPICWYVEFLPDWAYIVRMLILPPILLYFDRSQKQSRLVMMVI